MRFNYIRFKNFLSYGDEMQELNFSDNGINLVIGKNNKDGGSNGSGKSSGVVESLVYGLFGKTTKKIKADEVTNNKTKKDCFVEVSFSIGRDSFNIMRYRNHTEYENSLILFKNNKDISGESKNDTQKYIENIIKVSFRSFILSIVLSQEKVENFAEKDSLERRKIIENLLMYDFISKYHKATKEILRTINPELNNLESKINEKKESINTLTENLLNYIENKEVEESQKQNKIKNLEAELEKLSKINPEYELEIRDTINNFKKDLNNLNSKIEATEDEISQQRSYIKKYDKSIKTKEKEIDEVKNNPKLCPIIEHRPVCPYLEKDETLENFLNKKKSELQEINRLKEESEDKLTKMGNILSDLESNYNSTKNKINELSSNLSSDLDYEEVKNAHEEIPRIKSEISILKKSNFDLSQDTYVEKCNTQIEELKSALNKLKKKWRRLEKEKTYYEWWKGALSNSPNSIKSYCINHILTSLNKYINYYLEYFKYDFSYFLNNELEDSIEKDGEDISFGNLSGGEKRALEISLVFALFEIVRMKIPDDINIVVLDELLSTNLDDVRVSSVIEILSELEERGLNVFVIDHKSYLKDNLDCRKVIEVSKDKKGFSRLAENGTQ
jgi:DNA repair exonuclease SbcCD ATPase subunit